jgi:hypothetical protein
MELTELEKEKREQILAAIAEQLPPIVFKNWKKWRDVLPVAPGTVANDDSLNKGPKEFVFMGRVKGYTRAAMIDYLREKVRFTA